MTQYDLGVFKLETNDLDGAIATFTRALTLAARLRRGPQQPRASRSDSKGRFDDAVAQFEQALRLRPGFEDAARNLDTVRKARQAK